MHYISLFGYVGLGTYGPPRVVKERVEWAKVTKRFAYKVGACDVYYAAKWLLQRHFDGPHHLAMEQGKSSCCLSTQHEGPRCQDNASMNAKVVVNPLAQLRQ
jgi:hypothetical protein